MLRLDPSLDHLGLVALLAILNLTACTNRAGDPRPTTAASPTPRLAVVGDRSGGRWLRHEVRGPARRVDVYIAKDEQPKPVLVLLHGSGCGPDFTVNPDGSLHETSVFQGAIGAALATVHVAIVERPGVEPLVFTASMSQADKVARFARASRECSEEFFNNATKTARVEDAALAIDAVRLEPWARQVIVAGHSEGTHVVTGLLRHSEASPVAAAGLFASAGPIAFFGGYVAQPVRDRDAFRRVFERVRAAQQLQDDAMWQGLPGRRWKTFWLDSTPIEDVHDSRVPLFVAQGSDDGTTLPADLFTLEAVRQQPDRPLRYVVLEHGTHEFEAPPGRDRMPEVFADFLRWALNEQRHTGVDSLR